MEDTFAQTLPVLLQSFLCMVSFAHTLHPPNLPILAQGADHTTRWPRAARARRWRVFVRTVMVQKKPYTVNKTYTRFQHKLFKDPPIKTIYTFISSVLLIRKCKKPFVLSSWSNLFYSLSPWAIKDICFSLLGHFLNWNYSVMSCDLAIAVL